MTTLRAGASPAPRAWMALALLTTTSLARAHSFDPALLATVPGRAGRRVRRGSGGSVVRVAGAGSIDPVGVSRVFRVSRHVLLPRPSFASARATAHPTNCSAS